jgi:hypothetical protein
MTSAAKSAGNSAQGHAHNAADSKPVKVGARIGIAAYGVTHLIIAWLALQLAFGSGGQTDQQGAFAALAQQPFGQFLLWFMAVGFVAVALWYLETAIWGYSYVDDKTKKTRKKVTAGVKVVVFAVLAVMAARTAMGGGGGNGQQQATAGVFGMPGGQILVGLAGLIVLGVGIKKIVDGIKTKFTEDMDLPSDRKARQAAIRSGQVGFVAKGTTIGLIGVLLTIAAVRYNPDQATGLDAALKTLAEQPFGTVLLVLMAIGLAAYAVFLAFDARYHRV